MLRAWPERRSPTIALHFTQAVWPRGDTMFRAQAIAAPRERLIEHFWLEPPRDWLGPIVLAGGMAARG